jgi:hypothetical protein
LAQAEEAKKPTFTVTWVGNEVNYVDGAWTKKVKTFQA